MKSLNQVLDQISFQFWKYCEKLQIESHALVSN